VTKRGEKRRVVCCRNEGWTITSAYGLATVIVARIIEFKCAEVSTKGPSRKKSGEN
jgi:hypothetical protein